MIRKPSKSEMGTNTPISGKLAGDEARVTACRYDVNFFARKLLPALIRARISRTNPR